MKPRTLVVVGLALAALVSTARVHAFDETPIGHVTRWRATQRPWHYHYSNAQYGQPVALVVPPTAELQTNYAWGSVGSRMSRIDHQYQRPWPNGRGTPAGFLPTPAWPSDTRQFGTHYIRGPW